MGNKTLRERRDAAFEHAKSLYSQFGEEVTDAQLAELKEALHEAEALDAELAKVKEANSVFEKLRNIDTGETPLQPEAKSLGEHFVKSAGDSLKQQGSRRLEISAPEFKAAGDPAKTTPLVDGFGTMYQRSIVNQRREKLVAADLMGSANVDLPTIKYLVEKANRIAEGTPASVAEGAQKPYVRFADLDIVTESLSKIAALTKLSDEMIADFGFVADWINNQLIYELSVVEEKQLISGDGTGSNVRGILNRSGIQTVTSAKKANWFDDLYSAISKVAQATPLTADGIIMNTADYEVLRLAKDGNGQYIAGGPFQGQYGVGGILVDPPVWGYRTVVTNNIPKGTALVGAFRQGSTILRKGGLRVDSSNTNADDFEKNLVTLRAEERIGLMVPLPSAFVKVTLTAGA